MNNMEIPVMNLLKLHLECMGVGQHRVAENRM